METMRQDCDILREREIDREIEIHKRNRQITEYLYFSQKQLPENIARALYDNKAQLNFER